VVVAEAGVAAVSEVAMTTTAALVAGEAAAAAEVVVLPVVLVTGSATTLRAGTTISRGGRTATGVMSPSLRALVAETTGEVSAAAGVAVVASAAVGAAMTAAVIGTAGQ